MNRNEAIKYAKSLLDKHGLNEWHVRLSTDASKPFLGACIYRDKTIALHALHIDTHPEPEVLDTIRHEVAHALLPPGHGHSNVWKEKAKELGCANTLPCATYGLDDEAIDAIRSGATLEIGFEERTEVIRTPTYKIHRLQDKCPTCGLVAKIAARTELPGTIILRYECGHFEFKTSSSKSHFETLTFDGIPTCKHTFGTNEYRTTCILCGAHKLYDYQIEGARFLEKANGRAALFDDMGVGKTIQALAYLKFNPEAFPYLWVTKSKIKYQHMKEIVRVLGVEFIPQIIATSKQLMVINPNLKGYIISYDLFRRLDPEMFKTANIQSIVLDECQAIKNPDSSRTQALRDVVKNIPRIIPLSGTPWKNRGSELFVALNMLDPKMFWSYKAFKDQHVRFITDPTTGKEKEGGFIDPPRFREKISHIALRRELADVLPELPPINRTKLYCEVPEHARQVYNDEAKKLKAIFNDALIDGTEDSFATQSKLNESIMRMRQIVGLAKVSGIVDHLQEFIEDTERKIVCFVHHIKVGELVFEQMSAWCRENGFEAPLQLLGNTSAESTGRIQDAFNLGKTKLLVASTLSAGEGLNLQYDCYDMIMAERQWNPANEIQPERRLLRLGQKSSVVNSIYALGDKTCDTIFDSLVEFKRMEFDNSMNKKGYVNEWDEKSIFKAMIKAIVAEVA